MVVTEALFTHGAILSSGMMRRQRDWRWHLLSIPVTNLSVNPARSTGPALMVGGWALQQLWLFWVAPIMGAILAASAYGMVSAQDLQPVAAVKAMAGGQAAKERLLSHGVWNQARA